MSDFLPPEGMALEAVGEALEAHFEVVRGGVSNVDRTFYDTFDALVHAERLSVVGEAGRLALVEPDSGVVRAGIAMTPPTEPLLALDLEPGALRDAMLPIVDVRALLALVRIRSRVRSFDVLDDERKTVVRIRLEEPALISAGRRHGALRPRLRLVAVRGYEDELLRVQETIEHELGFQAADQWLVEEAVRAAGGEPRGTSAKIDVPLRLGDRADMATAAVLRRLLEVMQANIDGMVADIDTEFLHDFRVAVRRSRAVQREFREVFPPAELEHFRAEFRWLQAVTGDPRDIDVYVLEFDHYRALVSEALRDDLAPLLAALRERRVTAHRSMVRALRSDRAGRLYADWARFLDELPDTPIEDRPPEATRTIGEVAGTHVWKVYKRMLKLGGAIDDTSPAEAYHDLRKQGKELRYLLELFAAPLYPAEIVKPMVKSLKALQDVLGRHQDREVQVATLRSLGDVVSARPGGAGALMAMGVLVERLSEDERAARAEFAESFAAFASKAQRELVKETFR